MGDRSGRSSCLISPSFKKKAQITPSLWVLSGMPAVLPHTVFCMKPPALSVWRNIGKIFSGPYRLPQIFSLPSASIIFPPPAASWLSLALSASPACSGMPPSYRQYIAKRSSFQLHSVVFLYSTKMLKHPPRLSTPFGKNPIILLTYFRWYSKISLPEPGISKNQDSRRN